MSRLHSRLKDWLIALGKANGYGAWTPDTGSDVEFSKIRNVKIDYRPDVVWKHQRTGKKVILELAFEEDYRQIVGEVFLASQLESFAKIYIIRPTGDEPFWRNIEKFLRLAFSNEGIIRVAHRPRFIIYKRGEKEDRIKQRILEVLTDEQWI